MLKKQSLFISIIAIAFLSVSCTSTPSDKYMTKNNDIEDLKQKMINHQCDSDPLVGTESGIKLIISAKKDELSGAKGLISINKYNKLSQELEGYSVEWELINREIMHSCKREARCQAQNRIKWNNCDKEMEAYERATNRGHDFLVRLRELEVGS